MRGILCRSHSIFCWGFLKGGRSYRRPYAPHIWSLFQLQKSCLVGKILIFSCWERDSKWWRFLTALQVSRYLPIGRWCDVLCCVVIMLCWPTVLIIRNWFRILYNRIVVDLLLHWYWWSEAYNYLTHYVQYKRKETVYALMSQKIFGSIWLKE